MPTLLQSLAPNPHFLPYETRINRLKPCNSTQDFTLRRRKISLQVEASTKTQSQPKTCEDDYYATLKALNSKGRSPRKSLGQVNKNPLQLFSYGISSNSLWAL